MVVDWWIRPITYNPKLSAFWRVIRKILIRLAPNIRQDSWSSYLAWGNLYRIAPGKGGNPGSRLCRLQESLCKRQLLLEPERLRPRRFLILAGRSWAGPFLDSTRILHE